MTYRNFLKFTVLGLTLQISILKHVILALHIAAQGDKI